MDRPLLMTHQVMLSDGPRLRAYDRAIERAVGPGDIVVDIGAGTLVLSMLALRHGAGHVYAVEGDPRMADVAARITADNDLKDRLTLIVADARTAQLPAGVRADVLVSEMMGNLGPEEQMAEVLAAVARRLLRPGGRVVPRRLVTRLAPIQFDGEGWGVWDDDRLGYRLDAVVDAVPPAAQLHFFQRAPRLLGPPVTVVDSELGRDGDARPRGGRRLSIDEPGRLHALVGYFEADLADGVALSNFPSYAGCNWATWIWPLRPTSVAAGDELRVEIHRPRRPDGVRVATDWRLECGVIRQRSA
ncbi:methyltransferase domain-containing protein [Dactylosporangium sp. CA-139066]|uniref:methyltransferase domain-containing protein n=1 Tax=Dactylosporangium sp. CA-139066 TaxID=3239930 RepID=UPI003D9025B4